jgi:predicted metal-binding protein
METLLAKALELGADKARAIDTGSVVVEEWVIWKCQYGCPLFGKDALHPPCAPSPERTRKVLGEYSKAILLNGPKGKKLNEVALALEGAAYEAGYYKAFAMIALTTAGEVLPGTEDAAAAST